MKNLARTSNDMQHLIPSPEPVIMTVDEVSDLLKIPRSSVYEKTRVRRGSVPPIPCRRTGKFLRFIRSEVLQWYLSLPQNTPLRRKRTRQVA